jgi:ectoine hydroxylase-related dioxygenase (phytanoyl-CoA dioxygenase family)
MRVIPGTQGMQLQEMKPRTDVDNVLSSGMDVSQVDETRAVDIVLKPGDVSIHHPNVIHGSNANTSPRWRRGLTIRYIPTSTRIITEKQWPSAFLLRGQAVEGINQYLAWPTYVEDRHMPFRGCETFGR